MRDVEDLEEKDRSQEQEDTFELDLDEESGSIDEVMREAVEAVERHHPENQEVGEEDSAADLIAATAESDGDEAARLRDQLVRTLADFDNFRKRSDREKADLRRFALFEALKDFLGVQDNLERAVGAAGSAEDLRQGVGMIVRQLEEVLRRYGVQVVEAEGADFDPTVHEAVGRVESHEVGRPTVVEVLQKGYQLHDRLLRPALVNVAVPPDGPRTIEIQDDEDEDGASTDSAETGRG